MSKIRTRSLEELKDKHIGSKGSVERDQYELELNMEVLGDFIKQTRKKLEMTQEELGHLVGVQKAQISKLESSAKNTTLKTLLKVFEAMDASVKLNILVSKRSLTPTNKHVRKTRSTRRPTSSKRQKV